MLLRIQSIKNRIVAIIFLVTVVTVGTGFAIIIPMDISRIMENMTEQASIAAKLVGESCVSSLTFGYPEKAEQNLGVLQSLPGFQKVWLYDAQGKLFAAYGQGKEIPPDSGERLDRYHHYDSGSLFLKEPIRYQDTVYGVIYLKISPGIRNQIVSRVLVVVGLMGGLFIIAYVLANLTQKVVSEPILNLARTAAKISDEANYGIRLAKNNTGELGILYRSFNDMLDTIQEREHERDAAEKNLLFKEQVIESSTGAVATVDLYGIVTYSNPAFMRLLGYKKIENVVNRSFAIYLETEEMFDQMLVSLERQRAWSRETRARHKNGSLFDAIISADTILDENGGAESYVITVSDISELRKTTRKMEKENLLKTSVQAISDGLRGLQEIPVLATHLLNGLNDFVDFQIGAVYTPDEDGVFVLRGSRALAHDIEFKEHVIPGESLVGQTVLDKKSIRISSIPQEYFTIRSGSGQACPAHIQTIPFIYNEKVKGIMELGAFTPFTPLDRELFERLNETVAIAIHASQSRSKLQELLEKTQAQSEELLSQTEEMQTQQEELRQTNKELEDQTRLLEEQQADIEYKNKELEKSRWLVEQKVADLEITSRYKSEFMANMSHELRTPLNSILLLSDVLAENRNDNLSGKQVEFAKSIYASGSELLALINDILDLSKVESGKMDMSPETVKLSELEQTVRRTFEPLAQEKGLLFDVRIEAGIPSAFVTDRQKLEQVLKNLLSNAVKFTENGSVSLIVRRPSEKDRRHCGNMDTDTALAFEVRDTGIGIPEDKFPVIFEAFKQVDGTTSRKFGGTGLGLSISKEIARLLGGIIALESIPGDGSVFTFYLPEKPAKGADNTQKNGDGAGSGKRPGPASAVFESGDELVGCDRHTIVEGDKSVLIIEDDTGFVKILAERAREQGFKVLIAPDGPTGLHYADFYKPSAIVLDLGLPGIDGWAVMERLKRNLKTRHIPVHIVSGKDTGPDIMKMGAVGFLAKPANLAKLEKVFGTLNHILSGPMRNVLVVEGDDEQGVAIRDIIGNGDVNVTCCRSGESARQLLEETNFDCLILDLNLPDIPGDEFLAFLSGEARLNTMPVIVYTGKSLTPDQQALLQAYAGSMIVKDADSPERLLDEITLFLHRVDTDLSESKQKILRNLYRKESVFKDKNILLVDDDMRNVFAINNILEDKGVRVHIGKNGLEALDCLAAHPDIDLVLMDMMMPEMDGYQATRKIRKQKAFKKLPVIALTAKAMKGDKAKCLEAGADDYLSKPVHKGKLLSMLRVWLYG